MNLRRGQIYIGRAYLESTSILLFDEIICFTMVTLPIFTQIGLILPNSFNDFQSSIDCVVKLLYFNAASDHHRTQLNLQNPGDTMTPLNWTSLKLYSNVTYLYPGTSTRSCWFQVWVARQLEVQGDWLTSHNVLWPSNVELVSMSVLNLIFSSGQLRYDRNYMFVKPVRVLCFFRGNSGSCQGSSAQRSVLPFNHI